MKLSDNEIRDITKLLEDGRPLPDEYRFKLFEEKREVELVWNGKTNEITNVVLPFQVIEQVDEPREETDSKMQLGLFDLDARGRQIKGWINKLIWGDNKLILSSLKNGPLREEIEKEGGIKLIYIDPPFDVGADFSMDIEVGNEQLHKQPTVLEELAYRDTWGKGQDSFLAMLYERLVLLRDLMSLDGNIFVHCDQRVNAPLRFLMQEVFGPENFRNEIIWQRTSAGKTVSGNLPKNSDYILWFTKTNDYQLFNFRKELSEENIKSFNKDDGDGRGPYTTQPIIKTSSPGPQTTYDYKNNNGKIWPCPKKGWRFNQKRMKELENNNRLVFTNVIREKYYLNERKEVGIQLSNIWTDISGNTLGYSQEFQGYPTQKPEKLLDRILIATTKEGDLVMDCFVGSGTTLAVAERLGRKWIGADLGKFAIHTSRKRMIDVQRDLKKAGKDYRAFEILNLGKYERQHYIGINPNLASDDQQKQAQKREKDFVDLILNAYKAESVEGFNTFYGKKAGRMVSIGPINLPVTRLFVEEVIDECLEKKLTKADILAFEFEMGLFPNMMDQAKSKGIDLALKYIPPDVFDKRVVEKNQVVFHDVCYIEVKPIVKKDSVAVQLVDFSVFYNQESVAQVESILKNGGNKLVVENGQIIKVSKDKSGIVTKEVLTKKWTDWIDYWAVDFDFENKKEIIRVLKSDAKPTQQKLDGSVDPEQMDFSDYEEKWTGDYIFENEWQSFRTKKNRDLELTSISKQVGIGRRKIAVKVVDIFGNDTMKVIEVTI